MIWDRRLYRRALMVLALGIGLIMALSLVGCGGKDKEVETDVVQPSEPLPPPPAPEPRDPTPVAPAIDYASVPPQQYGINDVFFAFDRFDISSEAAATLRSNAEIMRGIQNATWVVEGHTDERGTIEYNLALGEKRAQATRDFLVSLGVPNGQLRVTSYGESRPFVQGSNEEAWSANRRAHFALP